MESIGNLDLVPPARRVSGVGGSFRMAPFTHVSRDRPSRFGDGGFGVLYAARTFRTALLETMHHHGRFMAATKQSPGWTSQFRELVLDIDAGLEELRGLTPSDPVLDPEDYAAAQKLGRDLRAAGAEGVVYPSVRDAGGECVGLFFPDLATSVIQGRHLDYHWDGTRTDMYREAGRVYRLTGFG